MVIVKTDFDYISLGKRIRKSRKLKNLTQEQLAELCDLSTAHIGHIERGTRALSIESLVLIAQELDVSTDYLLFDVINNKDRNLTALLSSLSTIETSKADKLFSIIKILVDNTDKL